MKRGVKIGIIFLSHKKKVKTMGMGVKVLINVKNDNGTFNTEYGYILRRLNCDLYEIWGETSQSVLWLSREEFKELPKEE